LKGRTPSPLMSLKLLTAIFFLLVLTSKDVAAVTPSDVENHMDAGFGVCCLHKRL
jgi:hypothetical protein